MKSKKSDLDSYRRIRKPVPPPTRVERDRREEIKRREDKKEMERNHRRDKGGPL